MSENITGKDWPDLEKLLWIMTSIHIWDKEPDTLLQRALKLWFTAKEFLEMAHEVEEIIATGIPINCPADLTEALKKAFEQVV